MLERMHLSAASTLPEALGMAYALLGPEAKVAAIPDGVSVIVNPSRCL